MGSYAKLAFAMLLIVNIIIVMLPSSIPVNASDITINSTYIKLYGLDSWAEEYISMTDDCAVSFQLEISGAQEIDCWVSKGESVTVTADGYIEPISETIYWVGNIGYYEPTGVEGEVVTHEYEFGKSEITVTADGVDYIVEVEVIDYAKAYTNNLIDEYIANNITDSMSQYEKVEKACEFVAGYDYSVLYQSPEKMIITGAGGDCWASASTVVRICERMGMNCWVRNGNKDSGSGTGHRNAIIEGDGVYYIGEAAYVETAPRYYSVSIRNSLFCYYYTNSGDIAVYQYDGEESPETLIIPETIDGKTVVSIADNFYVGSSLSNTKEIQIPETVSHIGNNAFYNCVNLETVNIPDNVTYIGENAFYNCNKLTGIEIPEKVDTICAGAFSYTSIEEITIPASVTSVKGDPFGSCNKLKNIYVDEENTVYESIDGVLFSEDGNELIKFPAGRSGSYIVPEGTTRLGDYSFGFTDNLIKVEVPDSVSSIGEYCFYRSGILSCRLPSSVSALPLASFYGCTNLHNIEFSSAVSTIEDYALYNCSNLKSVYFNGTEQDYEAISIGENNSPLGDAAVIYSGDGETEIQKYAVTYDLNNGSGETLSDTYYSVENTYKIFSNVFSEDSVDVKTWNTAPDGSGTEYASGYEFTPTEDMTLYAQWTTKLYKIYFYRNYSYYTYMEALPTEEKTHDVTYTLPTRIPTISGEKFVSWNTKSDGTGTTYNPGSTFTENHNLTLYAQWEESYCTVTFIANGGEDAPKTMKRKYDVKYVLPSKTPTRYGYDFRYWTTSANGGTVYFPSKEYTMKGNLILYANWKAHVYTISFDSNGGTTTVGSQTKTHDVATSLTYTRPVREGYTFVAWNTQPDGSGISYSAGSKYTEEGDVTLYAQWSKDYVITFDANGGQGTPDTIYKSAGKSVTLPNTEPVREGYGFLYWNTEPDGSGTIYTILSEYSDDSDVVLYAQWEGRYLIQFDANGGENTPPSSIKSEGVPITLYQAKPVREGYTFVCWNTKADGSGDSYNYYGQYSADCDATLYAQWKVTTYIVSYSANYTGGYSNETIPGPQEKVYNTELILDPTAPTRYGYSFVEWNTVSDGSGTVYMPGDSYNTNQALYLYAQWKPNEYTIQFFANGGTGAPETIDCYHKESVTVPETIPTREGYTFEYWIESDEPDSGGVIWYPGSTHTMYGSATLYASWILNTYNVTYDANGGSGSPASQTKKHGTDITLSNTVPVYDGFEFVGWNTASDGSGTSYNAGAAYSENEDATLYAQWEEIVIHYHSYESAVTPPTCEAGGYTTYTCSECGDSYVADETAALGHDYDSEVTKAATCTEDGVTTYTCRNDSGHSYTEPIAATGHKYEPVVTAPTCEAGGCTTYTCSACGDSYTADETAALGHSYASEITAPTCEAGGYTTYTCSACGDSYTADETAALGHDYDSEITKAATCTEDGVTTYTCRNDSSHTYTEPIAAGHTVVVDEAVEPTETETGLTEGSHCSVCNEVLVKQEIIPATGVPATAIELNSSNLSLTVGGSAELTAAVTPENTTDTVVWESSDTSVATVSDGVVAAIGEGTATITATAGSCSANCVVTVEAEESPDVSYGTPTASIEVLGYTTLNLSWTPENGYEGYEVERASAENGPWTKMADVESSNESSFRHGALTFNRSYYFRVRGYYTGSDGERVYGSWSETVSAKPVPVISGVKAVSSSYNSVTVSWTKNTTANGYYVYRSEDNGATWKLVKTITKNSTTSWKNTSLKSGATYTYKVIPYRLSGKTKVKGIEGVASVTIIPAKPTSLTVSVTSSKPKLTWKKVTGAQGYEVWRSDSYNGEYSLVKTIPSGSTVTWTDEAIASNYCYKIRAFRDTNYGTVYSDFTSAVTATVKLGAPTAFAASASYSSIKVSWHKVTGAKGYKVYRSTDGVNFSLVKTITKSTTLSWINTGLTNGKTYYYYVIPYASTSTGTASEIVSAVPTISKPTLTVASSGYYLKLSWKKVSGATGYNIYRSADGESFELIKQITSGSTVSYSNTSVVRGVQYSYKITAVRNGVEGPESAIKTSTPTLAAPTGIKAARVTADSIKVTWKKSSGATGYEILRATSKSGTYEVVGFVSGNSTVAYTDTGLESAKTYYYKVRAVRTLDGFTSYSSNSSAYGSAKTSLYAPSGFAVSNDGYQSIRLTWKAASCADGYVIYRATSKSGTYSVIAEVGGDELFYVDTGLTTGKTYYYKIKTLHNNPSGTVYSSASSYKSATANLKAPTNLRFEYSPEYVEVYWTANDEATGYQVYRSAKQSSGYTRQIAVDETAFTEYTEGDEIKLDTPYRMGEVRFIRFSNVSASKTYYYKVRSVKTTESKTYYSSYCTAKSVKTVVQTPTIKSISSLNDGTSVLTFSNAMGAQSYAVYRATSKSGTYTNVTSQCEISFDETTGLNTVVVPTPTDGKTYYFKIRGIYSGSKTYYSSYSAVKSVVA